VRYVSTADVVIPSGSTSVTGSVTCAVVGTIGNVLANQITQVVQGPGSGPPLPAGLTVTNPADNSSGLNAETNIAYKARFTLAQQTNKGGTRSAVLAAALGVQPNLTVSYCDRVDPSGNTRPASFTLYVAPLGSTPPTDGGILIEVQTALEGNPTEGIQPVRAGGIQYNVVSPSGLALTASGVIQPIANLPTGVTPAQVLQACVDAWFAYADGIGLDPYGAATTARLGQVYAALYAVQFAGVNCVAYADPLTINGGTADIVAAQGVLFYATAPTLSLA
jgi:hypothetical protein